MIREVQNPSSRPLITSKYSMPSFLVLSSIRKVVNSKVFFQNDPDCEANGNDGRLSDFRIHHQLWGTYRDQYLLHISASLQGVTCCGTFLSLRVFQKGDKAVRGEVSHVT